uniref:Calx-beta domain-containing protein n=1 Tax=Brugia pahangi TaxID=6280 RepID=A0A0N4T0L8_BRUPA
LWRSTGIFLSEEGSVRFSGLGSAGRDCVTYKVCGVASSINSALKLYQYGAVFFSLIEFQAGARLRTVHMQLNNKETVRCGDLKVEVIWIFVDNNMPTQLVTLFRAVPPFIRKQITAE